MMVCQFMQFLKFRALSNKVKQWTLLSLDFIKLLVRALNSNQDEKCS